jgi:OOP family OmpA-OmpF porin
MKNTAHVLRFAAGSLLLLGMATAHAQSAVNTTGYVVDQRGLVAKSGTGLCWRTGYWTPAMAIMECDPGLMPKPAPEPAPVAPPPPPPPKPAPPPPPPVAKTLSLAVTDLFEFNKATVTPAAKALIDSEILAKLGGFSSIRVVMVGGHTDRLGSQQYNQKLSEKRAEAVKAYLVSKGVDGSKIEATGFGKTSPVKFGCDDKLPRKKLIECLAPNRRVVIEVSGTAK